MYRFLLYVCRSLLYVLGLFCLGLVSLECSFCRGISLYTYSFLSPRDVVGCVWGYGCMSALIHHSYIHSYTTHTPLIHHSYTTHTPLTWVMSHMYEGMGVWVCVWSWSVWSQHHTPPIQKMGTPSHRKKKEQITLFSVKNPKYWTGTEIGRSLK